jgi:dTDP-4-dehydrorhamnose 3,5-epimerase
VERISTNLDGVFLLRPDIFRDHRGLFVKTYQTKMFADLGIAFIPKEEFFSISNRNVVRGMHFQIPPYDHAKIVYCLNGSILDVVVDLRKSSATYRQCWASELNDKSRELVFIPRGCAHGFLSREDGTLVVYATSTEYSPEQDKGVRWDSFGFDWQCTKPILSERDTSFPPLGAFASPF